MTEKWLQSKGNPYTNLPVRARTHIPVRARLRRGATNHRVPIVQHQPKYNKYKQYGFGGALFRDYDKDGVSNVFDCKPFNKKKQDVIAPVAYGGMNEMYGKQENARLNRIYQKQIDDLRKAEEERVKELARIQGETRIIQQNVYTDVPTVYSAKDDRWVSASSAEGQRVKEETKNANASLSSSSRSKNSGNVVLSTEPSTDREVISSLPSGTGKIIVKPSEAVQFANNKIQVVGTPRQTFAQRVGLSIKTLSTKSAFNRK